MSLMPSKDPLVCDCECHEGFSHVGHLAPCCDMCPVCREQIKSGFMDLHQIECAPQETNNTAAS